MQHSCSHYNAFRSIPWQTCTYLRTWQHQMTTMKQPFHCNLQPEIQEPHRTTHSSLLHHFPSSPFPFVTTSLCHHPVIVTTLHQGQFHRFLFFCCVLLCYALLCDLPPFIKVNSTASLSPPFSKVNSTASYSCVMYCYVMYCYVIYHPSSRSIPPLLILVLCIVMLCIVI